MNRLGMRSYLGFFFCILFGLQAEACAMDGLSNHAESDAR